MISRISFWAEKGRVTAMLWLDFDFRTGTVNPKFSGLSVYFDGPYGAGFLDAYRFGEDWIDVPVPEFGRYDAKDADEWLRDYVSSVNARLGSGPKPEPSNPPSGDLRPLTISRASPCLRSGAEYLAAKTAEDARSIAYMPWDASKETEPYPEPRS